VPSNGSTTSGFGSIIVLSGDTAYVTAWDGIHILSRSNGVFTETGKVTPSEPNSGGGFGHSLAVSGDKMLVGAIGDDTNGYRAGAAHVFVRVGDVWTEKAKLLPSDGAESRRFGMAVAFAGDSLFVGQRHESWDLGAVYEFVLPSSNGAACSTGQTCESGFCVDGVCCDAACGGGDGTDCQACSVNMGAATDGVCAPIAAGSTCRAAAFDCDVAEVCDGSSIACPADSVSPDGAVCPGGACQAGICEMNAGTGGAGGGSSGETGGAGDNGDDAGGCSCRVAGDSSGKTGLLAALAMGFVAAVRRRRVRTSA
jgi:MYXO-CTERM domain-containing protein